ncbi:hypothetical protein MAH1_20510 [Sessilibacter sp. MAH1]
MQIYKYGSGYLDLRLCESEIESIRSEPLIIRFKARLPSSVFELSRDNYSSNR